MNSLCPAGDLNAALTPYRALLGQVDQLCARIAAAYPDQLACRAGCAACCTLQGVLPVEAVSLVLAMAKLPVAESEGLRNRLATVVDDEHCPLLTDDSCPLYAARPIICRTHGLPLLVDDCHGRRVDRCPLNFSTLVTLPGLAVIDLERLNQVLVVANRHFLATCFAATSLPERIPLRELPAFFSPSCS